MGVEREATPPCKGVGRARAAHDEAPRRPPAGASFQSLAQVARGQAPYAMDAP